MAELDDLDLEFRSLVDRMDAQEGVEPEPQVGTSETARALEIGGAFNRLTDQFRAERQQETEKGLFGSFFDGITSTVKEVGDQFRADPKVREMLLLPVTAPIEASQT